MPDLNSLTAMANKYFLTETVKYIMNGEASLKVDGITYFRDLYQNMQLLKSGDSIFLMGWQFSGNKEFPDSNGKPFVDVLDELYKRGVDVRIILLYTIPFSLYAEAEKYAIDSRNTFFNLRKKGLPNVIIDTNCVFTGSHHLKAVCLKFPDRIVSYAGGIDIARKRFDTPQHPCLEINQDGSANVVPKPDSEGWHDIAVRLDGSPAFEVFRVFVQRWNTCVGERNAESKPGIHVSVDGTQGLPFADKVEPVKFFNKSLSGYEYVNSKVKKIDDSFLNNLQKFITVAGSNTLYPVALQANCSISEKYAALMRKNNPNNIVGLGGSGQPVANVLKAMRKAVSQAKKYIYLEDQFLNLRDTIAEKKVGLDFSLLFTELVGAIKRGVKVITVTGEKEGNSGVLGAQIKNKILDVIKDDPNGATLVKNYAGYQLRGIFVHSKILMIDDEFTIIGSCNPVARSYLGNDTELSYSIISGDGCGMPGSHFVKDMRISIWLEHCNLPEPEKTNPDYNALMQKFNAAKQEFDDVVVALGMWKLLWRKTPMTKFSFEKTPGSTLPKPRLIPLENGYY